MAALFCRCPLLPILSLSAWSRSPLDLPRHPTGVLSLDPWCAPWIGPSLYSSRLALLVLIPHDGASPLSVAASAGTASVTRSEVSFFLCPCGRYS